MSPSGDPGISLETATSLNFTMLSIIVLLYGFRRSYKGCTPGINILKGQLRTIRLWMVKMSMIGLVVFLVSCTYLSTKLPDMERQAIELTGIFGKGHLLRYGEYSLDINVILVYSMRLSEVLLVSSLFLLSSVWDPHLEPALGPALGPVLEPVSGPALGHALGHALEPQSELQPELQLEQQLVSRLGFVEGSRHVAPFTLPKIWAVFRIPICMLFYCNYLHLSLNLFVFIRILSSAVEFMVLGFIFILMAVKYTPSSSDTGHSGKTSSSGSEVPEDLESPKLLSILLLSYSVLKYVINLVDIPITLNSIHLYSISSLQVGLHLGIYLLLINMYSPMRKLSRNNAREPHYTLKDTKDRSIVPRTIIEFNESFFRE
jgi:hypothetical protein